MTDCLIFRIRFHKHGSGSRPWILCILYVLLVWWRGNHGSAVGWSFCFYVPILFRFTSKKFVYLIRHKRRKRLSFMYTNRIFRYFEFSVMSCLLRHLSAPSASVLLQPALAHAPPPFTFTEGGGLTCYLFRAQINSIVSCFRHSV